MLDLDSWTYNTKTYETDTPGFFPDFCRGREDKGWMASWKSFKEENAREDIDKTQAAVSDMQSA